MLTVSKLWDDCSCIYNWAGSTTPTGFKFNRGDVGWYGIVWCGTCIFAVHTENVLWTYVGTQDIRDLVGDSILRFLWNGHVGAEGNMGCENDYTAFGFGQSSVNWAIFHT
jgi:hypothetical protein